MGITMTTRLGLSVIMLSALMLAAPAIAQTSAPAADMSPSLLIEVGPSDNPDYRRMVFVKYLAQDQVTVAYKAYNRAEFIQVPDTTPDTLILACRNSPAATLEQIRAYQADEASALAAGEPPQITHFCIRDVPGWDAGNRAAYLDPIFDGMPHAAVLNN